MSPVDLDLGLSLPSLPSLDELADIVAGRADEHHEWPPPGMHQPVVVNVWTALVMSGSPDPPSGYWWSWADEVSPLLGVADVVLDALVAAGVAVVGPVRTAVQVLGRVPLVYRKVGTAMEWLKVGIHAQLGTTEQMIHTFNLTASGVAPVAPLPDTPQGLRDVAELVRVAWADAMNNNNQAGTRAILAMGSWVKYDYVTATVVSQNTASPKVYEKGLHLMTTEQPTERVNWNVPLAGTGTGVALPFEVACAVSLLTRAAGPRNRGRVYMGGMPVTCMEGTTGLFSESSPELLADGVGLFVQNMRTNTPWQVSIVSRRALASHEVVKTSVGLVPDSQRSRRWKQNENKRIGWTSPTL